MATLRLEKEQRILLHNLSWKAYELLIRALDGRRSARITYDRGAAEVMILSYEHESPCGLLGRMVCVLTEELDLPFAYGGSTTLRLRKKRRGLEADNCFWIANEPHIRGKKRLDLGVDPPPDLAIEVEVSRRVLKRIPIYETLRVPEIWRFGTQGLSFLVLGPDGHFKVVSSSRTFPGLKPEDLMTFITLHGQIEENALVRQFRAWVRQQIAAGVLTSPVF